MTTEQTLELFSDWGCPPYRSRIIVDEERKLLYCPIPKAACTAWKAALAGPNRPRDPRDLHRKYQGFTFLASLPKERFDAIQSGLFKFIFVRDPFSRLLASFKNKFENASTVPNKDAFWLNYGAQLKKHAIGAGIADDSAPDLSFREFVRLVYRMKPATMNEHWHPQALLALTGEISYDFVGRFERLSEDVAAVLPRLGVQSFPTITDIRQRPTNASQLVDTYYDTELRDMVREKYDVDFQTFGY